MAVPGGLASVAIYSQVMQSLLSPHGVCAVADVDAALARVFGAGVRPLHMDQALCDAMLSGWRSQQAARYIKAKTIEANESGVRRFAEHVGVGLGSGGPRMLMSTSRISSLARSGWRARRCGRISSD
jgi:hypothetical protein